MADSAALCHNLSGDYRITGTWESSSVSRETLPRADEWAFAFVARAVIDPVRIVVEHNPSVGTLSVNVLGKGLDPRWIDSSPKLPVTRLATCRDGRWHFEWAA